MESWSLVRLLEKLHADVQHRLDIARCTFAHPGTKGETSEGVWRELLEAYLPRRYHVTSGHVVDSRGDVSDQLDIIVADRQYSPFIFHFGGRCIVPAESIYAVFEVKQSLSAEQVRYAHAKLASVRRLHRTSLPIPHAGGEYPPKVPSAVLGGVLTLESTWTPGLGAPFLAALGAGSPEERIDLGCVAAHGAFWSTAAGDYHVATKRPATAFLFELIARLQACATVPMLDVRAYAQWLEQAP